MKVKIENLESFGVENFSSVGIRKIQIIVRKHMKHVKNIIKYV